MNEEKQFACNCGPEAEKKMEELHEWVAETFYKTNGPPAPEHYATALLYVMAGSYGAWIEGIPLDPGGWGAVEVKAEDEPNRNPPDGVSLYVQFDRLEDGIALSIKALHDKYGKSRPWVEEDE